VVLARPRQTEADSTPFNDEDNLAQSESRLQIAHSQDSKGDRTRKRLLDATAAEVARAGLAGTSINSIAALAGLKTGSVYFHFRSKDHLVEAMLEEGLRETLAVLDKALSDVPKTASAAARLRAAIRSHAFVAHDLKNYTIAVLAPNLGDNAYDSVHKKLRRAYASRWVQLIIDAQREGFAPGRSDPRLVRDMIFGALNAVVLAGRPPDQIVEALQALLGLAED
jgi:AcrR family transcriptional regulator